MGTYITCSPVSCTPCSLKKQLTTYLPNTRAPVRKDSTPVYLLVSSQFVGSLADLRPVTEAQLIGQQLLLKHDVQQVHGSIPLSTLPWMKIMMTNKDAAGCCKK